MPDGGDESGSDLTTACPSGVTGLDPAPVTHQLPPRTQRLPRQGRIITAAVTIPTQFHGDLPATVAATYADRDQRRPGRLDPAPAVPVLVLPDYTVGTTALTSAFLDNLKDGAPVIPASACHTAAAFTGSGRTLPGPTRSRPNPARRRGSRRPRHCARRWRG
ncbi:hypothetical protein ACFYZJ_20605 [Streptomyces sp. NPDC001848]|uniref:hypothetical protein n=1 Tax=Streptomyces sp. NPDC001848 TaxID=3364618 RepID=UPI0036A22A46